MNVALFFVPLEIPRERVRDTIASALAEFDLPPPRAVLLSSPAAAQRDGLHTFALGSPEPEGRGIHRGFFMDFLHGAFPIGFAGLDTARGEEVFELRGYGKAFLSLTSRGPLLAGTVDRITIDVPQKGLTNADLASASPGSAAHAVRQAAWGAIRIGLAQTGLRVGPHGLQGAETLAFARATRGGSLVPAAVPFFDQMLPGIDPQDAYPRETDDDRIGVPRAAPPPAPARALTLDDLVERENRVGDILRSGGDLHEAKRLLDEALASFPKSTRGLALRTMVLEKLGSPELEQALRQRFESGVSVKGRGDAMISNVVHPAQALADHLLRTGRPAEARAVIDRAASALTPHYAHHLDAIRARLPR